MSYTLRKLNVVKTVESASKRDALLTLGFKEVKSDEIKVEVKNKSTKPKNKAAQSKNKSDAKTHDDGNDSKQDSSSDENNANTQDTSNDGANGGDNE